MEVVHYSALNVVRRSNMQWVSKGTYDIAKCKKTTVDVHRLWRIHECGMIMREGHHVWQFGVEIEHYSVVQFDRITTFEAL